MCIMVMIIRSLMIYLTKKDLQEIWLGRSFHLGKIGSRKNLTFAVLINRDQFVKRPDICADSCYFFSNRTTYLFSLKFSKIEYYKVGMIKTYGKTEDVPTGYMGGITAGYLDSEPIKKTLCWYAF